MDSNVSVELTVVDRLTRQLRLLNDFQAEIQAGCWELQPGADHVFWSDIMFALHELEVHPENLITIEDAAQFIYEPDRKLVEQKKVELDQLGYVEYYFHIITPGKTKRIHAREKKIIVNDQVVYQGIWQDEAGQRELQRPLAEQNKKLARELKIFERAEQAGDTGSWQINLETFETYYSDNIYRIHGLAPQSISPHVDVFRKYIHPDDKAVVIRNQEKSYVEMIPLHLQYRIVRDDGQVRHISQVSHLVKNEKGEHLLTGSTQDVTEQKQLEIRLTEANDILVLQNELFIEAEKTGKLGTWQVNIETRKAIYSANLYRMYGLKPHAVPPGLENFIHFVHPDDREMIRGADTKSYTELIAPEFTFRITRADGKPRVLMQKSRFIKDGEGRQMLIGIVQDITGQQMQEKLLRETNEKLEVQSESCQHAEKIASIGSWTWNLDTNELYYSDSVYAIYGLKAQSLSPGFANFGRFMHPDDRERMKEMPEKVRTAGEPMTVEYRIIRPDGQLRYLRGRNQPITTANGQTIIIGATQDVTEEVLLQQQLMDRILFAEVLQDTMPDRIIVTDSANNIVSWNKSCENFYKVKKEGVIGKNFFDVRPEAKVPEMLDRFKRSLQGEIIHIPVVSIPQMPGFFELLMVPFRNEAGNVMGVVHVLHDITQQQYFQHQLAVRLELIEKLQEASIDRIIALDADLYFQVWNLQCEKYYGLAKDKVIGRHILEVFAGFKTNALYQHCISALEGQTVYATASDKGELAVYQDSYFIPLKNDLKEITGILWIMHDLRERFEADERLRTSEAHLKTAQEIAMIGSFEMNLHAQTIQWSDQTYKIFDYPAGENVTPAKVDARIHPDDLAVVRRQVQALEAGMEEVADSTFRIFNTSGELKFLHSRSQLIKDNAGHAVKIVGIVQDITAKKLAEHEVLKHRELLQQAESIGKVGSWELDKTSGKLVWSNEVYRTYGYAPQVFEPTLKFFLNTIHAGDRDEVKKALVGNETQEAFTLVYRIVTLDGETRHIQTRGRALEDDFGNMTRVIGTMQDISDHKSLEEELRGRNERMRIRYELHRQGDKLKNIGSFQWEVATGKMIWAENLSRMLGQNPYDIEPTVETLLELVHTDDRDAVNSQLEIAKHTTGHMLRDFEFRVPVGNEIKYFRLSGRILSKPDRSVLGTIMDITRDATLREELAQKIRFVEALNEELTALTFVASHDLREPLRKIQVFSDWLATKEADRLSDEGKDRFKRIQAAVSRMEELIDDILSFSRINATDKRLIPVSLNDVLRDVLTDLQETIVQENAAIEHEELPVVKGNVSQCLQLFRNLLGNALKYKKPGQPPLITIKSTCVKGDEIEQSTGPNGAQYFKISVVDNGIGFDQQYSKKIFQMFQRLHGVSEYPGTGMGLAICKKVMDYHEGFIFAYGEQEKGATFECYFPKT